jgi:hypothetical protein
LVWSAHFCAGNDTDGLIVPAQTVPFLSQPLELGDGLEVPRAAGGSLGANQPLEIEAAISRPEQGNLDGVRRESLIVAAPGDLAEKIDVAEGGCQLEVETLT